MAGTYGSIPMDTRKVSDRPHSWQEAYDILGGNQRKKLGTKVYLQRKSDGDIEVLLYETAIVTFHNDGTFTLDSGGWWTKTTRAEIAAFVPFNIQTHLHVWYLYPSDMETVNQKGKDYTQYAHPVRKGDRDRMTAWDENVGRIHVDQNGKPVRD